jgi:hypothetical protein
VLLRGGTFANAYAADLNLSTPTFDNRDMLARNRLANVSFFVCSVGELFVLAILVGILAGIVKADDTQSNTRALSVVCAYSAAVWSKWSITP